MSEMYVKDVIFSFRHLYLENLEKINKKLKRYINYDSPLIDDITIYIDNGKYKDTSIRAKFKFKKKSFGRTLCNISEFLGKDYYLRYPAVISKDEKGEYSASKGLSIKKQKIAREIECLLKEEFNKQISGSFSCNGTNVTFTGHDITISSPDFIVCYDCVGDIIYVYSRNHMTLWEIMNTLFDISELDKYHKSHIKKEEKIVDAESCETNPYNPGDYTITEKEKAFTLKRIKNSKLSRYI